MDLAPAAAPDKRLVDGFMASYPAKSLARRSNSLSLYSQQLPAVAFDQFMPLVELSTVISAPRQRVFDLARSIDAHQDSAEGTRERAVAGVTSGLIGLNDEVTWEARHLGVKQRLTVRVTSFNRPQYFQDIMVTGAFKYMRHGHQFLEHPSGTLMIDHFEFQSPFGILGRIVDRLFLIAYMRRFLARRSGFLKELAESKAWSRYLKSDTGS